MCSLHAEMQEPGFYRILEWSNINKIDYYQATIEATSGDSAIKKYEEMVRGSLEDEYEE